MYIWYSEDDSALFQATDLDQEHLDLEQVRKAQVQESLVMEKEERHHWQVRQARAQESLVMEN